MLNKPFGSSTNYSFSFSGTLKTSENKSYAIKASEMMKLSSGNSIISVSYTHLDVYKRQDIMCF